MIFSLLLLRPTGDDISRIARMILEKKNIKFSEKYQEKTDEMQSVCKIYLNGILFYLLSFFPPLHIAFCFRKMTLFLKKKIDLFFLRK